MQPVRTWRAFPESWHIWVIAICVAHALDIYTTALGLRLGIPEGNPFMSMVLSSYSEFAMYGVKAVLAALVILTVLRFQRRFPLVWPLFQAITLLVLLVVANNVAEISKVINSA